MFNKWVLVKISAGISHNFMGVAIKKITKKSWFCFLGAGGVAVALFTKIFLGGAGIINLPKLESDARNAITQTGVINVASAEIPGWSGGGSDSAGDSCDSGGSCSDSGSY